MDRYLIIEQSMRSFVQSIRTNRRHCRLTQDPIYASLFLLLIMPFFSCEYIIEVHAR